MLKFFVTILVLQIAISNAFKIQPRIVNGVISNTSDFSFFVKVQQQKSAGVCSAVLISDSWVITAAHCFEGFGPIDVYLGIRPDGTYKTTVQAQLSDVHIYPLFNKDRGLYDIGLIKLPEPIALSETIQPIELSPNCAIDDEAEVRVSVAGIGRKFLAQRLVDADGLLRHTTFATCPRSEYDDISYDVEGKNIPSIILARAEDGSDLGPGDSGGPVLLETDRTLVAVAKSTLYKYEPPLQKFTKIAYFFDWISYKTGLSLPQCTEQAPIHQ